MNSEYRHIVLAYSGGLDTSAALHFLKARFGCTVTAYCANLGQREDWEGLEGRALAAGADHLVVDDLREHFLRDFVFPALGMNAEYERNYLLGTPLARPAIVEGMVGHAARVGADALAHGCTPKGNDQLRFELAAAQLSPDLPTIAPWRIWDLASREDCLAYCELHGIPVVHSHSDLLSHDENIAHYTTEGDYLEDIQNPFDRRGSSRTTSLQEAPDHPRRITVTFREGIPVALDGRECPAVPLFEALNRIGAENGVGVQDIIENRINGMKVRGVFENPALVLLHRAHRMLENATMAPEVQRIRDMLTPIYGDIVYRGLWFSRQRAAIQALAAVSQAHVTGHVLLELYRGNGTPIAVCSGESLYSRDLVTLHRGAGFDAAVADGLVRTLAMQCRVEAERERAGARPLPRIPPHWRHS